MVLHEFKKAYLCIFVPFPPNSSINKNIFHPSLSSLKQILSPQKDGGIHADAVWFPPLESSILFICSLNSLHESLNRSSTSVQKNLTAPTQVQQKCMLTRNLHFLSLTTLFPAASSVSALWHMLPLRKD